MSPRRFIVIGIAVLVLCACPLGTLVAQTTWMHPPIQQGVALEFSKAQFDGGDKFKFWTSTVFLYGKWQASRDLSVIFELPVANVDYSETYNWYYPPNTVTFRGTRFGNPYLGVELGGEGSPLIGELGFRPPLVGDEAWANHYPLVIGNFIAYDRFEAFVPKLMTFSGALGYRGRTTSGDLNSTVKILLGPTAMVPNEGDPEVFADAFAEYWLQYRPVIFGIGFTGRYLVTQEDVDFGDRTVFQGKTALQWAFGRVHPGIHIQLPLDDDLSDEVELVYGVDLAIDLFPKGKSDNVGSSFR